MDIQVCKCLVDLIGIRNLCATPIACASYINDIKGLHTEILVHLLSRQDNTLEDLWATTQRNGIPSFYEELVAKMNKKFTTKGMLSSLYSGEWITPHRLLDLKGDPNIYCGSFHDLRYSPNLSLWVDSVELYVGNPNVIPEVRIYDLERGELLWQSDLSIVTTEGFIVVPVNKEFFCKRLFVGYNAGVVRSLDAREKGYPYYKRLCSQNCGCNGAYYFAFGGCIDVSGRPVWEDRQNNSSEMGMVVCCSVNCSLEKWVCKNKPRMVQALKHFLALELLDQIATSTSLNIATLISEEKFSRLVSRISRKYNTAMGNIITAANIEDPVCIPCSEDGTKLQYFTT